MNISLSEFILLLIIILLVVKPEQLPEVAYTMGRWIQRIQSWLSKLTAETNRLITAASSIEQRITRQSTDIMHSLSADTNLTATDDKKLSNTQTNPNQE